MNKRYKKIIQCFLLLFIFLLVFYIVKHYFQPLFVILFLLYASTPIYKFLEKHAVFNQKVNAVVSILFVNLMFFITMFMIGNFLVGQFQEFMLHGYKAVYTSTMEVLEKIAASTKMNISELSSKLKNNYTNLLNSQFLRKGAVYTTEGIVTYFIGNIAAYFILIDRYVIFNAVEGFLTSDHISILKKKITQINRLLKVELLLVLVMTLITIFGFYALNIENAFILGIICGLLDILPYIGTIFVFLPLALHKIYTEQYIIAFGLVSLYVLLLINRQIIEMKFVSDKLKIHPLVVFLSLYIGMKIFGVIGLFMGPLYVISAREIIIS